MSSTLVSCVTTCIYHHNSICICTRCSMQYAACNMYALDTRHTQTAQRESERQHAALVQGALESCWWCWTHSHTSLNGASLPFGPSGIDPSRLAHGWVLRRARPTATGSPST